MASILKVDQLQKPDGSTPTAADLGIDVAGSVVQVVTKQYTGANPISTSIDAVSDNHGSWPTIFDFQFTPKSSNSVLVVTATCNIRSFADSNYGPQFAICENSTGTVKPMLTNGGQSNGLWFAGNNHIGASANVWSPVVTHTVFNNSTTTPYNISYRFANENGNGGTVQIEANGAYNQSVITVYEIAQ